MILVACDDASKDEASGGDLAGVEISSGSEAGSESGSEAGSEAGVVSMEPVYGEIEATINYSGELTGQLIVGVFNEIPPVTPPVSFKIINEPTFPQVITLDFIEEGDWYVFAFLDAEPINSQSPSDTDPQGASELVSVLGEMLHSVSVDLVDP